MIRLASKPWSRMADEFITDSIGEFAFGACHSLTTASFPTTLASIGQAAFRKCFSLDNVDLFAKKAGCWCVVEENCKPFKNHTQQHNNKINSSTKNNHSRLKYTTLKYLFSLLHTFSFSLSNFTQARQLWHACSFFFVSPNL